VRYCVRCVNENRKKCKRLRWQAANHGCHCFDRAFLLAGVYATHATQAIAFKWKPSLINDFVFEQDWQYSTGRHVKPLTFCAKKKNTRLYSVRPAASKQLRSESSRLRDMAILRACFCSKGEHFERSLWTDDINFVNLCHLQCNFCLTVTTLGLHISFRKRACNVDNKFVLQGSARQNWVW